MIKIDTIFQCCYVDIIARPYPKSPPEPEDMAPPPQGNERILLVDDEKLLADIGEQMLKNLGYQVFAITSSIEALRAAAAGKTGLALTLYRQFDPMASHFRAEVAIPVTDSTPQSNYTRREFRGGRYFRMTLRGEHRFIPLGWYALSCHCRMHKIKLDRARPWLEIYHDEPEQVTDSNEITTVLYIPIR